MLTVCSKWPAHRDNNSSDENQLADREEWWALLRAAHERARTNATKEFVRV